MPVDLLGVFAAGLLTFVTPCVLPLLPIYLAAMAGGLQAVSGGRRGRLLVRAGWFSAGFELVFVLLGLGATAVGGFLGEHRAGLQLAGAVLIGLFGLKFLGLIRIRWLDSTLRADDRKLMTRYGWLNALVLGLVFAAGWSPCVGPVLGSVLTYTASTTSDPLTGAMYLATYGVGFALPLLALAAFAEAGLRLLGRLGPHLRRIEIGLGALLLVVAGTLVAGAWPQLASRSPAGPGSAAPAVASATAAATPTMLAFTSADCPICRRMKPVIEAIEQQCDGHRVRVRQVDLSDPKNRELIGTYHLVGVPTFVFVDEQGQEAARLVGEQSLASLRRALGALRAEPCPGLAILQPDGARLDPADAGPSRPPAAPCPAPDPAVDQTPATGGATCGGV